MSLYFVKIAFRLALPLASVLGMLAVGEPLPDAAAPESERIAVLAETAVQIAPQLSVEIDEAREELEAGARELRRAAASMRWMVTLPAASSRRCGSPACAG
jgi:hypothetical protein